MPIVIAYLPIGFAAGVHGSASGLDWFWPPLISLIQYSGAAQFVLVSLLAAGTEPGIIVVTLLVLNSRHVFFGLPFVGQLPSGPIQRLAGIFWLTDEVYSVLTSRKDGQRPSLHRVGLFPYLAWFGGTCIGVAVGPLLDIPTASLAFSLAALFVVLLIEQVKAHKSVVPIAVAAVIWFTSLALLPSLELGARLFVATSAIALAFSVIFLVQRDNSGAAK